MQDAARPFFAQVLRLADCLGDPLHQPRGLVRIELVGHEHPLCWGIGRNGLRDVVNEIAFGARVANGRGHLLARGDFVIGDQALRAVANVFVLLPRAPSRLSGAAGLRGFGRRGAFQGLDAGLFIRTDQVDALRVQVRRGGVHLADRFDLRLELRRVPLWRVEPPLGVVQIKVGLILKNARQSSGKCLPQDRVGRLRQRVPAASNGSRGAHWPAGLHRRGRGAGRFAPP